MGAIFQSTSSTSPASMYGGSWEKIEGRFLLGSSSSYSVSSTGGEAEHTLNLAETPTHFHYAEKYYWHGPDSQNVIAGYLSNTDLGGGIPVEHNQWIGTICGNPDLDTVVIPMDQPHNNMPPYYSVYIWRRVA